MAKEWTDEEVQAEIREAVRIVAEDRERATYTSLHSKYGQQQEEGKQEEGETGKKPPPQKEKKEEEKPKKRSIWWAETDDE